MRKKRKYVFRRLKPRNLTLWCKIVKARLRVGVNLGCRPQEWDEDESPGALADARANEELEELDWLLENGLYGIASEVWDEIEEDRTPEEARRRSVAKIARTHVHRKLKESTRHADTPAPDVPTSAAPTPLTPKRLPFTRTFSPASGFAKSAGRDPAFHIADAGSLFDGYHSTVSSVGTDYTNTFVSVRERKAVFAVLDNADTPVCAKPLSMKSGIGEQRLEKVLAVLLREKLVSRVEIGGGVRYCRS